MLMPPNKGISIKVNLRPSSNGKWTGDFTLFDHQGSEVNIQRFIASKEFPTREAAKEQALEEAKAAIAHQNEEPRPGPGKAL